MTPRVVRRVVLLILVAVAACDRIVDLGLGRSGDGGFSIDGNQAFPDDGGFGALDTPLGRLDAGSASVDAPSTGDARFPGLDGG